LERRAEWKEEDRGMQQKMDEIEDAFSRRYGNLTPEELYEAELEFEADAMEEAGTTDVIVPEVREPRGTGAVGPAGGQPDQQPHHDPENHLTPKELRKVTGYQPGDHRGYRQPEKMKLPLVTTRNGNGPKGNYKKVEKVTSFRRNSNFISAQISTQPTDSREVVENTEKVSRSFSLGVESFSVCGNAQPTVSGGVPSERGCTSESPSDKIFSPTSPRQQQPQSPVAFADNPQPAPLKTTSPVPPPPPQEMRKCTECRKMFHAPYGGRICPGCAEQQKKKPPPPLYKCAECGLTQVPKEGDLCFNCDEL
jgi:hypothetical protein